jgi:hypothetical protein
MTNPSATPAPEANHTTPRSSAPAHDAATLWDRAKDLFTTVLTFIASTTATFARRILSAHERRELLACLKPVEKLIRLVMLARAANWLVTDPEGQRLRATATPELAPAPRRAALPSRLINLGATLAHCHTRIDPRVEERLARERAAIDHFDPDTWSCSFNVLRNPWRDFDETPAAKPAPMTRSVWVMFLDDPNAAPRKTSTPGRTEAASTLALARRIEALARILANPAPAIRRLARRLAGLSRGEIADPYIPVFRLRRWRHGAPEAREAILMLATSVDALNASIPPPDPG